MASSSPPAPALGRVARPLRPDRVRQDRRRRRPARPARRRGRSRPTRPRSTRASRSSPRRPTTRRGSSASCRSTRTSRSASTSGSRTPRSTTVGSVPLVVGGTGLYFRAALSELELPPPPAPAVARTGRREYDRLGPEAAHALLAERDPAAAARVHANDRRRVVRALELAETGASLAPEHDRLWTEDTAPADDDRRARPAARRARPTGSRQRTRAMAAAGAAEEARRAWADAALGDRAQGARPRGVRDAARATRPSRAVTLATRRLARYQRKWLRRMPGVVTLDGEPACGGDRR